jgi:hypothetical protein
LEPNRAAQSVANDGRDPGAPHAAAVLSLTSACALRVAGSSQEAIVVPPTAVTTNPTATPVFSWISLPKKSARADRGPAVDGETTCEVITVQMASIENKLSKTRTKLLEIAVELFGSIETSSLHCG